MRGRVGRRIACARHSRRPGGDQEETGRGPLVLPFWGNATRWRLSDPCPRLAPSSRPLVGCCLGSALAYAAVRRINVLVEDMVREAAAGEGGSEDWTLPQQLEDLARCVWIATLLHCALNCIHFAH